MSLAPGTQLGDHRILARIGFGAYGEVYEGEHAITRRRDAIKILAGGRLHATEQEQRFLQEIQVQASLHHPNIAAVYNAFSTPYGLALVMELVPGEPLSAILARCRIPPQRGIGLALEMLAALSYAHWQGVVHRDIKPENIIVTPQGSVKLTDFGLARSGSSPRLTQTGAFAGSPCYMSPEQARGTKEADARSDVYSAGVVLYEVVTGRLPFTGESTIEVLLAHQYHQPAPPEEFEPAIGAALSQVILTAIEKDPDARYQTASAFYTALQEVAALTAPAPPAAPIVSPRPRWATLAASACAVLAAGAFGAVVVRPRTGPPAVQSRPARDSSEVVQPAFLPITREPDPVVPPRPVDAVSNPPSNPLTPPPPRLPGRARTSLPAPPQGLRITGSTPDQPHAPAEAEVSGVKLSEPPHSEVAAAAGSAPDSAVVTAPPAAVAQPTETSPSALEADTAKESSPKRRNVVVRAFQKMFHQPASTSKPAPGKQP